MIESDEVLRRVTVPVQRIATGEVVCGGIADCILSPHCVTIKRNDHFRRVAFAAKMIAGHTAFSGKEATGFILIAAVQCVQ